MIFILSLFASFSFSITTFYDHQGREYRLHQTKDLKPLIVHLHGCDQDATDFYQLLKMKDRKVDANVLFVEQTTFWHPIRCWNWYYSVNQSDIFNSEAQTLTQKILQIKKQINATDIHLVGFSSGAGQVANLAFVYPQWFSSVLLHSGPAYGVANGLLQATELLKTGSTTKDPSVKLPIESKKLQHVFIVQGSLDSVVHPNNALILIEQFRKLFKIKTPVDIDKEKQKLIFKEKSIDFWRLPINHQWSGGSANAPYSSPDSEDVLDFYYTSILGI